MKIFLIGFMGSGKTYWGKIWAKHKNCSFVDLDEMIVQQEKKTIASIFEIHGENYFREKETIALKSISDTSCSIIACGGGTPCFANNMQWMNENGLTVYLAASAKYIHDKVLSEKEKRPLLKKVNTGELFFFIEKKLKERELFYKQAKIIVPVEELAENSIEKIIAYSL